jgi:hypothetical protein
LANINRNEDGSRYANRKLVSYKNWQAGSLPRNCVTNTAFEAYSSASLAHM